MSNQPVELTLENLANAVEEQYGEFKALLDSDDPEARELRELFGDEFIAERDREVNEYVDRIRASAAQQKDEEK